MNEEYLYYEMRTVGPEKWENHSFQLLRGTKEVVQKVDRAIQDGRRFIVVQLGDCIIDRT
jgi:hypothetical protein